MVPGAVGHDVALARLITPFAARKGYKAAKTNRRTHDRARSPLSTDCEIRGGSRAENCSEVQSFAAEFAGGDRLLGRQHA